MDDSLLADCGISGCVLGSMRSDMVESLTRVPIANLKKLREVLFVKSKELTLVHNEDMVVTRRDSSINPIRGKLIDDIFVLDRCIKNKSTVPRILLKNGKRSKRELDDFRSLQPSTCAQSVVDHQVDDCGDEVSTMGAGAPDQQGNQVRPACGMKRSQDDDDTQAGKDSEDRSRIQFNAISKELNLLRQDINFVKSNISSIQAGVDNNNIAVISALKADMVQMETAIADLRSQARLCPNLQTKTQPL